MRELQRGDAVRFIRAARNVHGEVSKDFTPWHLEQTFLLGEETTDQLPGVPKGVRIFEVENNNIGGTVTEHGIEGGKFWGWVRSDDVDLVEL
ncbi:hypothetical protein CN155_04975 [Sinorhizobium meliloti]|uniref:hypothetical protein n=1 Tax=Rhizobium meliloti TaxID=382 RepID=UPI000FD7D5CC|nr:hypothetical protein [Sinorhizobium meliloti]RVK60614.1 hypothetical protein CN155_04975 [Sinorhizobium meliloti]